jgi:hypothetical protein
MPGKRNVVGVEDISDKSELEDYDLFDDLPAFSVNVDPSILLPKEDFPFLHSDRDQGTFVRKKIINVPIINDCISKTQGLFLVLIYKTF